MNVSIYGLFCACAKCREERPGEIRYVGQTCQGLRKRLTNHAADTVNPNSPKVRWFKKHGASNIRIYLLDIVSEAEADESEIRWISDLETFTLGLNATTGGGGTRGYTHSEQGRRSIGFASQRLRGNSKNALEDETARVVKEMYWRGQSISLIADELGINRTTVGKICNGTAYTDIPWPIGPRYKPPKRYRPLGVTRSPESIAKGRASRPGVLDDWEVQDIRDRYARGLSSVTELSEMYGKGRHTIYGIIWKRLYKSVPDKLEDET